VGFTAEATNQLLGTKGSKLQRAECSSKSFR
jgi:hypothetical protein